MDKEYRSKRNEEGLEPFWSAFCWSAAAAVFQQVRLQLGMGFFRRAYFELYPSTPIFRLE